METENKQVILDRLITERDRLNNLILIAPRDTDKAELEELNLFIDLISESIEIDKLIDKAG